MTLPPKSLRCWGCSGVGQRNNDYSDDCYTCDSTGIYYPALVKWLVNPKNDPDKVTYSAYDNSKKFWYEIPLSRLVEKWIFQKRPPNWGVWPRLTSFDFVADVSTPDAHPILIDR